MLLTKPGQALSEAELPVPTPQSGEVLVRIRACGVCRTDLHIADGDLPQPCLPLVLGHEIVGTVVGKGNQARRFRVGERVGIAWLGGTCGACEFCRADQENLCDRATFTGYTRDGGYAEYTLADERFCYALPANYSDVEAAPLLCAGLIGYRTLSKAGEAHSLGIYGFGAAAHIVAQIARYQGREVFAFTRPGDVVAQRFALGLGAVWAGDSTQAAPRKLDAALVFAPVGALILQALRAVRKGGRVVCGGIHMSDIPAFPYSLLWEERSVTSVANLTRRDGDEFLALAPKVPVRTEVEPFPLSRANQALDQLRTGKLRGAAVLVMDGADHQPHP